MALNSLTHILRLAQHATGAGHIDEALAELVEVLATTGQRIAHSVSKGALAGILGTVGTENVQGETQKQLDIIANDMLLSALAATDHVAGVASEEMEHCSPVVGKQQAPYLVLFDPLDGSSNIDVNVSIGTIFSILRTPSNTPITNASFLQAGNKQVAAGYIVYGPQVQLVLTLGNGVLGFTLDKDSGEFVLTAPHMTIPKATNEFSINMSNVRHWEKPVQRYIEELLAGATGVRQKDFNMRWIASMVADVHRVLTRGGVFMYPKDARDPKKPGKLRLLYEANPMSFLAEQAGGHAHNGLQRILDIEPTNLHERCSVVLGSSEEVERLYQYHNNKN